MIIRTIMVCVWFLAVATAAAQRERILPRKGASSLEGTSFVVGFMQNEVTNGSARPARLQIFISSEYDASVVITYPDGYITRKKIKAQSVYTEQVGERYMNETSEITTYQAIYVTSDIPVIVYTLNSRATSTDSYTAIPTKFLGTDYYAVCRGNDRYSKSTIQGAIDTQSRTSEFMLMAVENNTTFTITPTATTYTGGSSGIPITGRLDKGQCFLVKGGRGATGDNDLTGSHIVTSKPTAVVSGHVRSSMPTDTSSNKDHLIEMLPPTNLWGKAYATAPFARGDFPPVYRIVTSSDNTSVRITTRFGTTTEMFGAAGSFREFDDLEGPILWESDTTFLLVQFMPSGDKRNGFLEDEYIDPAMVVSPALEQYVQSALFQFPVLEKQWLDMDDPPLDQFYYVTIIADSVAVPSLRIGKDYVAALNPAIITQRIPGTSLRWVNVRLSPGAYTVSCDTGMFSGVMYGTSRADSYANIFGLRYGPPPPPDYTPPEYSLTVDCGVVKGWVTDVGTDTVGIEEILVVPSMTYNYQYTIGTPLDSAGKRMITGRIVDLWQDAQLVIHTYDVSGNGKEWLYSYDAPSVRVPLKVEVDAGGSPPCNTFAMVNTDTSDLHVLGVSYEGDARIVLQSGAVVDTVLKPGDSIIVIICYTTSENVESAYGTVTFQLPCGLKRAVSIRSYSKARIEGSVYDFGPVRIGDTACAIVYVVNTGSSIVVVNSLTLAEQLPGFIVDTTLTDLPKSLMPGDSMHLRVCFTPTAEEAYERTDTARTAAVETFATTSYKGRGVRPRIPDILVDWGSRRIGRRFDSVMVARNLGEAVGIISKVTSTSDTGFVISDALQQPVSLPPLDSSFYAVSFAPLYETEYEWQAGYVVDWKYHDTVRVILRGKGTLPAVRTIDVHMGNVLLTQSKDSTCTLVVAAGTENLTIYKVSLAGPDQGAFTVPASLTGLTGMAIGEVLSGLVRFTPQRLGMHEMFVDVEHDAVAGTGRRTSRLRITGIGIVPDTTKLVASLENDMVYRACVDTTTPLLLRNAGNRSIIINRIDIVAGPVGMVYADTLPMELAPGESRSLVLGFTPDRNSSGDIRIDVRYDDSLKQSVTAQYSVAYPRPVVDATPGITAKPGDSIGVDIVVHMRDVYQDVPISLSGKLDIARERLDFNGATTQAFITDADGSRSLSVRFVKTSSHTTWELVGTVRAPYEVRWHIDALLLWLNPDPFALHTTVDETQCTDSSAAPTQVLQDICGDGLRVISFDQGYPPVLRVLGNPVVGDLEVDIDVPADMPVTLQLVDITGSRQVLAEKIPLHKGSQVIKFCRSAWGSGSFLLILQHQNGETGVPVMFVN